MGELFEFYNLSATIFIKKIQITLFLSKKREQRFNINVLSLK